jgi:hypothetical protein
MSPLRRRMIEDMTIRNLPPGTQQSYIHAVSKFGRYSVLSRARPEHFASKLRRTRRTALATFSSNMLQLSAGG